MWKARYTVSCICWDSELQEPAVPSCSRPGPDDVSVVVMCSQPFSNGLVTVMVPQLRRENSLLLWSVLDLNSPVHAFVGHDDVVLEFQWRPQKEGEVQKNPRSKVVLPASLLVKPVDL